MPRERPQKDLLRVRSADGTQIAAWRSGDGPPIVLVHGTTGDHDSFRLLRRPLGQSFTVYAIDRRGRGASDDGPPHGASGVAYTIDREFDDVASVVDAIGEQVVLLGHSFGANCALGAALLTAQVRHLILYEPDTGEIPVPPQILDGLDEMIAQGQREEALLLILQHIVGLGTDEVDAMRDAPSWEARIAAVHTVPRELRSQAERWFRAERFGSLRVPTLLLVGANSPEWARRGTEAVAAALPEATVTVLPGQAHSAHATAPKMVVEHVLRFLGAA